MASTTAVLNCQRFVLQQSLIIIMFLCEACSGVGRMPEIVSAQEIGTRAGTPNCVKINQVDIEVDEVNEVDEVDVVDEVDEVDVVDEVDEMEEVDKRLF